MCQTLSFWLRKGPGWSWSLPSQGFAIQHWCHSTHELLSRCLQVSVTAAYMLIDVACFISGWVVIPPSWKQLDSWAKSLWFKYLLPSWAHQGREVRQQVQHLEKFGAGSNLGGGHGLRHYHPAQMRCVWSTICWTGTACFGDIVGWQVLDLIQWNDRLINLDASLISCV